ncbi:MAG: hypothetical protein ACPIOQ_69480, partial [Promethearchaeia archaeon]
SQHHDASRTTQRPGLPACLSGHPRLDSLRVRVQSVEQDLEDVGLGVHVVGCRIKGVAILPLGCHSPNVCCRQRGPRPSMGLAPRTVSDCRLHRAQCRTAGCIGLLPNLEASLWVVATCPCASAHNPGSSNRAFAGLSANRVADWRLEG